MTEIESGFVRITHRRCEDCEIREDLHASGTPIPKRRHRVSKCETCGGKGEISNGIKESLDPYRRPVPPGRSQFYEAKRRARAHDERHRFRAYTDLFDICDMLMQIPPGGFNHGRTKDSESGGWRPLESQGRDGDVIWNPSFKNEVQPLKHGTRYAYQRAKCRCFVCRAWNARFTRRLATPKGERVDQARPTYAGGAFPQEAHEAAAA